MGSNEPFPLSMNEADNSPFGRLSDAVEASGGTRALPQAIENGDPDQIQYWYELISSVPFDELQDRFSEEDFFGIVRTIYLLMQWEHAQAEELKEIVERETTEAVEREESWEAEKAQLRAELSTMRERITAGAGMDSVNEAFRAEIDALTAENAQLKKAERERDREMAEQRDRADELEAKVQAAEREKALMTANQSQLEESIRELNRRMNTQSEASQRGSEWEQRKLRQRNEQALVLSEQIRELASQNDDLRAEIERLSRALEEATELLRGNARKFTEFDEQFEEAQSQLERLGTDNRELRELLAEREKALKERAEHVELSNREFAEMLQSKDARMELQRAEMQKLQSELEEAQIQLEVQGRPDELREKELERLRLELVSATETARKLFGLDEALPEEKSDDGGRKQKLVSDGQAGVEMRLRLIQMDRELEEREHALAEERELKREAEHQAEQKDMQIARLMTECQRYRKMAFGDAEAEMMRIEQQLKYRDRQIEQLNRRCSELQLELEELTERAGTETKAEGKAEEKAEKSEERVRKRVRIAERIVEEKEAEMEERSEESEVSEESEEISISKDEDGYKIEKMEEIEEMEEEKAEDVKKVKEKGRKKRERKSRGQLIREATDMNELHTEIILLVEELEQTEAEMDALKKLYGEREKQLMEAKRAEGKVRGEMERMREILMFEEEDPLERMGPDGENVPEPFSEFHLRERIEALELENMELRRFAENIAENSTDERERRAVEGTRRMVYLAVKEAKLERRVQIGQRMRRTMVEEMSSMKARMTRLITGEECRSRQLLMDNELKQFELARLQNAVLHSVPISEYNRLMREHKRMLRDRFLAGSPDAGYQSKTDEEEEANDEVDRLYAGQQLNICRGSIVDADSLQLKCRQLQQLNDVLSSQNVAMVKEAEKLKAEHSELNAFLDDLEAETELKSMLANIERRFLHALREQFESSEERDVLRAELQNSERNFRESRDHWFGERQRLVNVIGQLHSALQRLHRHQIVQAPYLTTRHLEVLAEHLRMARQRESEAKKFEAEVEGRAEAFERREYALMARAEALDEVVRNNYELQAVQVALQGYQLNVLTIGTELERTRKKLEKLEKAMEERMEELIELRETLENFQYVRGIDLKKLEEQIGEGIVEEEKEDDGRNGNEMEEEKMISAEGDEVASSRKGQQQQKKRVIVVDSAPEWAAEQLQMVREQARLYVDSYKEQLERQSKTLEEYRLLVEQLKAELITGRPIVEEKKRKEDEKMEEENEMRRKKTVRMKSADELLRGEEAEERWERRFRTMERTVKVLEEENAELETERMRLVEVIRQKEKAEEQRRKEERHKRKKNAQVQVNLMHSSEKGEKPMKEMEEREEMADEAEEEEEAEEDPVKSGSSGRSSEGRGGEAEEEEEGASDSGTVKDIDQQQNRNGQRTSRRASSAAAVPRSEASTHTIPGRAGGPPMDMDIETMVLRHRNETRRQRMRVIELERRNKELSEQFAALRERSRLAMRTRPLQAAGGVESVSETMRRENDRLRKQNAKLNALLEEQKAEMERMQNRIRRAEAQERAGTDAWEERKRAQHANDALRKRLAECAERERRLEERLERRERHIEQLGRERERVADQGIVQQEAIGQWRAEKAELVRRERMLEAGKQEAENRCRELTQRLELLARENVKLRNSASKHLQEQKPLLEKGSSRNAQIQTDDTVIYSRRGTEIDRTHFASQKKKESEGISERWEEVRTENQSLSEQLQMAEAQQRETADQLKRLRETHSNLLAEHNKMLRAEKRRREDEAEGAGEKSAGIALLRDKLEAKEREVDKQRHLIIELERKIWRFEISSEKDQRENGRKQHYFDE